MKNDNHHIKLVNKVCPVCVKRPAWKHLSYQAEATWSKSEYVMIACPTCFSDIWKGEL